MQIRAIPGASGHISIGYPIASRSRTIQGYFSPNSAHCSNAGTCSLSGYFSSGRLHRRRHLLGLESDHAKHPRLRPLLALGLHQPGQLHRRGHLLESRRNEPEQLHRHQGLHQIAIHVEKPVSKQRWRLGFWYLDSRRMDASGNLDGRRADARRLERQHLDAEQPQHLERLRHGPRLSRLSELSDRERQQ